MPAEKTRADCIRWYLTGAASDGAAQADPDLSLGKYRAANRITWLSGTISNPISNVTFTAISGNCGIGLAYLEATGASELKFTAPSGAQGAAVTIENGETKIVEDADTNKFVQVTRTSAVNLTGTATISNAAQFNNCLGFDNVTSSEASAGDTEYRCICAKNESAGNVTNFAVWLATLGTQRVSAAAQLGASGSGTIGCSSGDFTDWPTSGFCRIETSADAEREIVYYSSRTATVLTVPTAGRGLLGTSAAAGAATDKIYPVPGIRIAGEAPASQPDGAFTDETVNGEGTQPGGLTWKSGIRAADGVAMLTPLTTLYLYGLWIERAVPVGMIALAAVENAIQWSFDS